METLLTFAFIMAIFFARLAQNAIGTVRDILVVRGQRTKAAIYSFAETLIWVVVFSFIIKGIFDEPLCAETIFKVLAFAGGFAAGSYAGVFVEERMAIGYATVQVISMSKSKEVGEVLCRHFPVTVIKARGRKGTRKIYQSILQRRQLSKFLASVDGVDPKAFITIMDTRSVMRGIAKVRP